MNPATATQAVSPFPPPPEYAQCYTTERISSGSCPPFPPPPVQSEFTVFGEEYKLDDEIIRSLPSQGIRQLYNSKYEWKSGMKKLNRSAMTAFLDLLDILIRCPDHNERTEKLNDIQTIFINMHHLINEYRPLQARDTLKLMQSIQLDELQKTVTRFREHLDAGREALRVELSTRDIKLLPVPRPSALSGITIDSDEEQEMPVLHQTEDMGDPTSRRLRKELQQLMTDPPNGVVVEGDPCDKDLKEWRVGVVGAKGTLYEGESFVLQFRFSSNYPFNSPEVTFVGDNVPIHPHVYSNGHICLSILSDDWTPALSVQSVCLSILSMLSSAREKKRPPDNAFYIRTCSKTPTKTRWWFHDDSV